MHFPDNGSPIPSNQLTKLDFKFRDLFKSNKVKDTVFEEVGIVFFFQKRVKFL